MCNWNALHAPLPPEQVDSDLQRSALHFKKRGDLALVMVKDAKRAEALASATLRALQAFAAEVTRRPWPTGRGHCARALCAALGGGRGGPPK